MEISSRLQTFANPHFTAIANASEKAKENSARDSVNMSNEALLLTEALRTAQNAPDIREDKVAQLKAAIAAGTYTVDGRMIAEKMLGEETSLFI